MKRILSLALIVALSSLLAACPKKPTTVPNANAGQVVAPVSGASTGSASADANQVRPLANDSASSAGSEGVLASTIRFEYDSSEIKAEYAPVISAQGKRLAADRRAAVRLEGPHRRAWLGRIQRRAGRASCTGGQEGALAAGRERIAAVDGQLRRGAAGHRRSR